jgi:hypothetical protein
MRPPMRPSGSTVSGQPVIGQAEDDWVYFDHPQHAPAEHTLNIDFHNPERGPSARVAVELSETSARALAAAIQAALDVADGLPA